MPGGRRSPADEHGADVPALEGFGPGHPGGRQPDIGPEQAGDAGASTVGSDDPRGAKLFVPTVGEVAEADAAHGAAVSGEVDQRHAVTQLGARGRGMLGQPGVEAAVAEHPAPAVDLDQQVDEAVVGAVLEIRV